MSKRNYKVNHAIRVLYQAIGTGTGLTVTMEIFDETGVKDLINFPDVTMVEKGASGRYTGCILCFQERSSTRDSYIRDEVK